MNFFSRQALARRHSHILLIGFVLALGCIALAVHLVTATLSMVFAGGGSLIRPTQPAIVMIGIVWLTMVLGAFFRWMDVRSGGAALAVRFGARPVPDITRDDAERRLQAIVSEMAVASSCAKPGIFVLDAESAINAFVVGSDDSSAALVVSRGALDLLDRDQLTAVVAHEFGHIAEGDLPLNMRLLIALGGLMAIDEVGRLLTSVRTEKRQVHPGTFVGYLLRVFGCVGVLLGSLLRAAFSRQREFLADASAVQFSRKPFALASALDVIHRTGDPEALHSRQAGELVHLCFQSGSDAPWYRRLLSTHPTIQERIRAIDPHFETKRRKQEARVARNQVQAGESTAWQGNTALPMSAVTVGAVPLLHTTLSNQSGSSGAAKNQPVTKIDADRKSDSLDINATGLSDRIVLLLPDEKSCLAVLFALFASQNALRRAAWLDAIAFSFDPRFAALVKEQLTVMPAELSGDQLGLIEHATAVLSRRVGFQNRQRVLIKLEGLLSADKDYSLKSYATLQLIRRKLGVDFPVIEALVDDTLSVAERRRVKTFDAMGEEFALLLSLIVESSGSADAVQDAEFKRVLKCYTDVAYPRKSASESGVVDALESAFQTLYVQPKPIRQAFVQHCIEIVERDQKTVAAERALLDLFAASLGCEELAA